MLYVPHKGFKVYFEHTKYILFSMLYVIFYFIIKNNDFQLQRINIRSFSVMEEKVRYLILIKIFMQKNVLFKGSMHQRDSL